LDTDYVDLNVPELRDYYVNQGIVNVAISFDDEQTYFAVPTTLDGVAYSYDYTTGSVRLYAQDPILDSGIAVPIPQHLFIKISLTEADFDKKMLWNRNRNPAVQNRILRIKSYRPGGIII